MPTYVIQFSLLVQLVSGAFSFLKSSFDCRAGFSFPYPVYAYTLEFVFLVLYMLAEYPRIFLGLWRWSVSQSDLASLINTILLAPQTRFY